MASLPVFPIPLVHFLLDLCVIRQALFLSRLSRREEAIESALLSIAGYPWNWSAWSLLGSCIGDGEEVGLHFNFTTADRSLTRCVLAIFHAPVDTIVHDTSAGTHVSSKNAQ